MNISCLLTLVVPIHSPILYAILVFCFCNLILSKVCGVSVMSLNNIMNNLSLIVMKMIRRYMPLAY